MADNGSAGLTRRLVRLLRRPITDADRHRAALHVLDWVGCAAAGAKTPPGLAMISYGRSLPSGPCRSVGGLSLTSRDAALVNGSVGNVLEMDDFYRTALVHPGPVVVPAALAVAQEIGAPGDAVLDAVIRGFEAMIRIGRSVGPTHYKHFHNTATCGVFGSAAAAGSLLGLDERQMVDALGNAGTQASGLWQCRLEDTMTKQLHNGRAAQSGILAAQLATHGFTGPEHILEGPLGFYAGFCPDGQPELLLAGSDGPWMVNGTSFKPWPACRHTHPTIDAALALRERAKIPAIRRIVVSTYLDAVQVCDRLTPRTPVEAKFSLQHASAVVLLRGIPALADFDVPAAADAKVAALRGKVVLREDARFTSAYPAHFGASLQLELESGEVLSHEIPDALGDPENPLPEDSLRKKAHMLLADAGYSPEAIRGVVGAAMELSANAGVERLVRYLA